MAVAPHTFFRFVADHVDLVMALYERGTVDEAGLYTLIVRHRSDAQPAPEHIRRQLEELGVVERAADADAAVELSQPVVEMLSWLTRRQRRASAVVLRAYLEQMQRTGQEIDEAVREGDSNKALLTLADLDGTIERVRLLSQGNRESVVTEAQAMRAATGDVSAVERFGAVRRLWEGHLTPLQQLVSVHGEMERLLDRTKQALGDGERKFQAHGALRQSFLRTAARLARMRRLVAEDHHAALTEVAPLYEQLRRDSRWLLGASRALHLLRSQGPAALSIDKRLGLMGWRKRDLLSDERLRARLTALVGYEPEPPRPIAAAPPPPEVALITQDELHSALAQAAPVHDALALILSRWPDRPLTAQLRALCLVTGGSFGAVEVPPDSELRHYPLQRGHIEAWPLMIREVPR